MAVNLTVIFGAGASVDVVTYGSRLVKQSSLQPRGVKNLFDKNDVLEDISLHYSDVNTVLPELKRVTPNGTSIEEYLKQLKYTKQNHKIRQFRQFPLLLQEYFATVSTHYCSSPQNYVSLLDYTLVNEINKVAYVTLNYDLLFDWALERHSYTRNKFSRENTNIQKYIPDDKWMYLKLHGSVDWGRNIKEEYIKYKGADFNDLLKNIDELADSIDDCLEENIIMDLTYRSGSGRPRANIYPAISVPTGESKLNCLESQQEIFKKHLNDCLHYLIIGFSAKDSHILDFLDKKETGFGNVMLVSSSGESGNMVRSEINSYGQLGNKFSHKQIQVYPGNGFDAFVNDPAGLVAYIKSLN